MDCTVRGTNLNYDIIGSGKPLLILNKSMIPHLEPIFDDCYRWKRVYMDVPGIGKSQAKDWMKSSDDVLDIILDFIDIMLGTEKFLLYGFSYCGYLARGVLKKRMEQVEGAALICPVITADSSRRNVSDSGLLFRNEEFFESLDECDAEELNGYVVQDEIVWKKVQQLRNVEIGSFDMGFYNRLKKTGCYDLSFDVDDLPVPFEKPALIVTGMQDRVVGHIDACKIIKNFSRATFSILDMAGHSLQVEQEQLFNTLIRDWLSRVEKESSHKSIVL